MVALRALGTSFLLVGGFYWLFIADPVYRPAQLNDALATVRAALTSPRTTLEEALIDQVQHELRARYGQSVRPSDKVHLVLPPRLVNWPDDLSGTRDFYGYADYVPESGYIWRPQTSVSDAYGSLLQRVDLSRAYSSDAMLLNALTELNRARDTVDLKRHFGTQDIASLKAAAGALVSSVKSRSGNSSKRIYRLSAQYYAEALNRYLNQAHRVSVADNEPLRRRFTTSPGPITWLRGGASVSVSARGLTPVGIVAGEGGVTSTTAPATTQMQTEVTFKRVGILNIRAGDWLHRDAIAFFERQGLIQEADDFWLHDLPRVPTMLVVAAEPNVAIDLVGIDPRDLVGSALNIGTVPVGMRGAARLDTTGSTAKVYYEPESIFILAVVSQEARPR